MRRPRRIPRLRLCGLPIGGSAWRGIAERSEHLLGAGSVLASCSSRHSWVEPLFAEAKDWHGLRRLRLRGLRNANIHGLLIAAGQNLKRYLAASGWGRRHAPCGSLLALPREPG